MCLYFHLKGPQTEIGTNRGSGPERSLVRALRPSTRPQPRGPLRRPLPPARAEQVHLAMPPVDKALPRVATGASCVTRRLPGPAGCHLLPGGAGTAPTPGPRSSEPGGLASPPASGPGHSSGPRFPDVLHTGHPRLLGPVCLPERCWEPPDKDTDGERGGDPRELCAHPAPGPPGDPGTTNVTDGL